MSFLVAQLNPYKKKKIFLHSLPSCRCCVTLLPSQGSNHSHVRCKIQDMLLSVLNKGSNWGDLQGTKLHKQVAGIHLNNSIIHFCFCYERKTSINTGPNTMITLLRSNFSSAPFGVWEFVIRTILSQSRGEIPSFSVSYILVPACGQITIPSRSFQAYFCIVLISVWEDQTSRGAHVAFSDRVLAAKGSAL